MVMSMIMMNNDDNGIVDNNINDNKDQDDGKE